MTATEPRTPRHGSHAATASWAADALGAALAAGGLALGVAAVAGTPQWLGAVPPMWLAALLLGAGGLLRAGAQWVATDLGLRAAIARKSAERARHWPALLAAPRATRLTGEDVSRAVDSIEMLEGYEARFRPLRSAAVVAPLLVALIVALASPASAAILLFTLPPFVAGLALAGTAARATAERQLGALGDLNALFLDRLRALPEIRLFGAEDRVMRQMAEASRDLAHRTIATLRIAFLSGGVIEFFAAIAVALVAIYAGFSLLGILPFPVPESLSLLSAFFVLAMAPEFYLPFRRLAAAYHDKQLGEAAEAALAVAEPLPPSGTAPFTGLSARALIVRHPQGPEIGPVSFELPATGLLVLRGPTGSGKSTLLAAIADHADIAGGTLDWAAGGPPPLAWAGQRPLILAGTLASNLALAAPETPPDAIEAIARSLALGPLIEARGLHGEIDWRGSGLSGGERRRIGVARALIAGRPLTLLDEPTADLDEETAAELRRTISDWSRKQAIIIATHDLALTARADKVLLLP
ncbi:ATP-binding cassette domain-containing protein [Sandaracinobacter neustonicus]|uniref:ATP-binding cassette domain-containing protein n=1 Tax=Sandaracinobacter neustonicus TaxID=1715348 RepID=A0A501XHT9_9SPHN|nr:ATP-binding cassette domain-containing protein [Sandaracinobacter neustonicus]TPE60172.1 ATP-binding cassette domain-containing protein [Sandaracinobacter neustonicus]